MFDPSIGLLVAGNEHYSRSGNGWYPISSCGESEEGPSYIAVTAGICGFLAVPVLGAIICGIRKQYAEYRRKRAIACAYNTTNGTTTEVATTTAVAITTASQSVTPSPPQQQLKGENPAAGDDDSEEQAVFRKCRDLLHSDRYLLHSELERTSWCSLLLRYVSKMEMILMRINEN